MNNLQKTTNVTTELAEAKTQDFLLNTAMFEQIDRFAQIMASGKATIPNHLKNSPADCMAVTMQALQWGMNPFSVAQKTHVVNGSLGYEAQLVNAAVSSSTAITGRFHYEYGGDWISDEDETAWCRVGAVLRGEDEITWGETVYPAKQKVKNSPLWKTDPKQQTAYLALKKWARLYTPAVILGVYTSDEIEEFQDARDITPRKSELVVNPQLKTVEQERKPETIDNEVNPALTNLIKKINDATSVDDFNDCASDAIKLPKQDQETARAAYKSAVNRIKSSRAQDEAEQLFGGQN